MRRLLFVECMLLIFLITVQNSTQQKKQNSSIRKVDNFKDFKMLMRTKTNVLVIYINNEIEARTIFKVFKKVAETMKGRATLVSINCAGSEGKKLCKKLKIEKNAPYYIKHYKDGEFNKDYERSETYNSLLNFLLDPSGDAPWDEDPTATDIYHLANAIELKSFLKKGAATYMKSLIMYYAPWCAYCKIMKPEYAEAAKILKGEAMLAAIDVSRPDNSRLRIEFNITGFPTILYFESGVFRMVYNGKNKRDSLVMFIRDPLSMAEAKTETVVSWEEDSNLRHLRLDNFDKVLETVERALIIFYAPWCGHCRNLKPNLVKAEKTMLKEQIPGMIAVVDVTTQKELGARFNVKGYPTLKYFFRGEYLYDVNHRTDTAIVNFMKDPQEPVIPLPKIPWSEEESAVRHLSSDTFKYALRKVKHALVMFYAPWCGHCQTTKPEFVKAAENFTNDLMILFGAVDCIEEAAICSNLEIRSYPTFKYFNHHERVEDYTGGRKMADFVQYIHTQIEATKMQEHGMKSYDMAGFGVNVIQAHDGNFEQILGDTVPSFVMFHAQWCGHCNEVKPTFSRLATQLKTENVSIKLVAIDVTNNLKATDFGQIKTLPTFKMYSELTQVALYDGDRTLDNMHHFCKRTLELLKHRLDAAVEPCIVLLAWLLGFIVWQYGLAAWQV